METEIARYIDRNRLILPGEKILLALSGGPDSVCLFHLLNGLKEQLDFSLGLAHVNHGLRGMESDADETFVRELAKEYHLPLHVTFADVPLLKETLGTGTEDAARQARYEFFHRIMTEEGYDKTALAHNMNDQAETILHRLLRGAGLNGLAGMRPLRDGLFIRPLLETSRSEIEGWLREKEHAARLDSTNHELDYTRNRIRLELLPELQKYNPDLIRTLSSMSRSLAFDRNYLEEEAARMAERCLTKAGGSVILKESAFRLSEALSSRLIIEAVKRVRGTRSDIHAGHVLDTLELQKGDTGKRLDLTGGVTVYNHYGQLEFSLKREVRPMDPEPTVTVPLKGKIPSGSDEVSDEVSVEFGARISSDEIRQEKAGDGSGSSIWIDLEELPKEVELEPYRITFSLTPPEAGEAEGTLDAEKIGDGLNIRRRRPGDRMQPLGMKGHKKVKSIFIDRKVHRGIRDLVPVITDGNGEIAFIHPEITGEAFKIDGRTDKIIYITVTEREHAEKQ